MKPTAAWAPDDKAYYTDWDERPKKSKYNEPRNDAWNIPLVHKGVSEVLTEFRIIQNPKMYDTVNSA